MAGFKNVFNPKLILFILIGLAAVLRFSSLHLDYEHPDEIITLAVADRVMSTGILDTNWKLAAVPEYFKYPQYNFSSYILSCAAVLKVVHIILPNIHIDPLLLLRIYSAVLGLLIVVMVFFLGRQWFNIKTGLYAAFLTALTPLLYQDSLYARPETFITLLLILYLYLIGSQKLSLVSKFLFSSIIMGLLIATKVSLLILSPLLLLCFVPIEPREKMLGFHMKYMLLIFAGLFLGFMIGAPYALVNLQDYLMGINTLNYHYTTGHWPHGLADKQFFSRFFYSVDYFIATMGLAVILLSFLGGIFAFRHKNYHAVIIFIFGLFFAIRFGSYAVFFERNLSPVLPIFLLFAGYGIYQMTQLIAKIPIGFVKNIMLFLIIVLAIYPSFETTKNIRLGALAGVHSETVRETRHALESEYGVPATVIGFTKTYTQIMDKITTQCEPTLLQFPWPGDQYSLKALEELQLKSGYIIVDRVSSLFNDVPPSTLHTYFSPTIIFLYKAGEVCG